MPQPEEHEGSEVEWAEEAMYLSDELAALNDDDRPSWLYCMSCEANIDAGHPSYRRAAKAEEWADRADREQAWADLQRQRRIDQVAAEHAARQCSLPGIDQAEASDG